MPRPMWKGAISFGLVTIPVNLYSAVEGRETLAFHLLHKKDGSRIEQKRFCDGGVEVHGDGHEPEADGALPGRPRHWSQPAPA